MHGKHSSGVGAASTLKLTTISAVTRMSTYTKLRVKDSEKPHAAFSLDLQPDESVSNFQKHFIFKENN